MALKNLRQRIVAFVAGLLLGPTVVWAGLESATYISDLVASNPLSSDLASTADDHIRLLKSTIKTTFPNINNAVTVTDEQLNAVGASGVTGAANPTGTIGLTAVNGSATTYLRSDGAPALSQAIAPTWTAQHTFSASYAAGTGGALLSAANPSIKWNETGVTANNRLWFMNADAERFNFYVANDVEDTIASVFSVDRTGTTVDVVQFPTITSNSMRVGATLVAPSSGVLMTVGNLTTGISALQVQNDSATNAAVLVGSDQTGGATYVQFYDGNDPDSATGSISTNGTTTAYNTSSDERLKKNIKPAASARDLMLCIQIVGYDWIESRIHVDHGVTAQQLNRCAPYAVTRGKVWQVDKSALIPALIKYVQEQDARIARLEADANRRH